MSDAQRPVQASAPAAKKTYTPPTITECGSVAKLTMAKGTTSTELGQIIKRQCL